MKNPLPLPLLLFYVRLWKCGLCICIAFMCASKNWVQQVTKIWKLMFILLNIIVKIDYVCIAYDGMTDVKIKGEITFIILMTLSLLAYYIVRLYGINKFSITWKIRIKMITPLEGHTYTSRRLCVNVFYFLLFWWTWFHLFQYINTTYSTVNIDDNVSHKPIPWKWHSLICKEERKKNCSMDICCCCWFCFPPLPTVTNIIIIKIEIFETKQ